MHRARRDFCAARRFIGTVGQKDLPLDQSVQQVAGAFPVMGLAFGQLQGDRQTLGIDERMDLRRQPTARTTHATGSIVFFWVLAAC